MPNEYRYSECLSSKWTEALFIALALLFLWLAGRRLRAGKAGVLTAVFFSLFTVFFFYSVNYRYLTIDLSEESLTLTFGIFKWKVPLDNIAAWRYDEVPLLLRYGGAGIHFMFAGRRYRASFNFLEHPRVVLTFKQKVGPVQELSFSTRRPDELLVALEALKMAHASR